MHVLGPIEPPAALKDQMSRDLGTLGTSQREKRSLMHHVFSDFMRYLFDSKKTLFISSDKIGEHRWDSVFDNLELVLTHPNGWGGPQQSQLRAAAVRANIVPGTLEGRGA